MNLALLMLLAMVWGVVLLPSAIRNHRHSLHHSMGGFQRSMQVLSGGAPTQRRDVRHVLVPANAARIVAPPRGEALARERRRRSLVRLLAVAALATTVALVFGGAVLWAVALVADAALGAFMLALRRLAVRAARRRELVRLGDHRRDRVESGWEQRQAVGV